MCIRDSARLHPGGHGARARQHHADAEEEEAGEGVEADVEICLLYTSDAADERSSVDLGGRRIIKKKKTNRD